ncbi:MazG family protein [Pseudonocardia eucalypti]|uniref:MazG family protein n=1 Tax=Pseudonocardia eucalypti TaxID=648755 RepID=A0ABP9PXS2_9PSEU|nr:XTP/dITP diphosphohydrolase [Pseudonocardia eucalypti]
MRTLVVLADRLGAVLPASALPALRTADRVLADPSVPAGLTELAGAERLAETPTEWPDGSVALLCTDLSHPLAGSADEVHRTPEPTGAALLDAVAVMDRLRSPGGCPWDAEQTHRSLLTYLVEETYELHEAVEEADRPALREELGDVLLQVLFHARLAAEGAVKPFVAGPGAEAFGIDEVAADLVRKLVDRHPHVFGSGADVVHSASDQELRWDELKRVEKQRESSLDGVAMGQPAAALAAKLVSRARKAGLPTSLIDSADPMFRAVAAAKLAGTDPEQELRAAAREFASAVRAAERAAVDAGLDPHALTEENWRQHWPTG